MNLKLCLIFITIILVTPVLSFADDTPATGFPSAPEAPIDGGLSLLLAAGVGYGAKKLKEKRKK